MPLDSRKILHIAQAVARTFAGRQRTVVAVYLASGSYSYSTLQVIMRPEEILTRRSKMPTDTHRPLTRICLWLLCSVQTLQAWSTLPIQQPRHQQPLPVRPNTKSSKRCPSALFLAARTCASSCAVCANAQRLKGVIYANHPHNTRDTSYAHERTGLPARHHATINYRLGVLEERIQTLLQQNDPETMKPGEREQAVSRHLMLTMRLLSLRQQYTKANASADEQAMLDALMHGLQETKGQHPCNLRPFLRIQHVTIYRDMLYTRGKETGKMTQSQSSQTNRLLGYPDDLTIY